MTKVDISIIVPIYNSAKYLNDCFDSILSQDFENFEVICVNDGSTDDSQKIIDEYVKKDKRFKSFKKENGGQSSARNLGLTKAKGEFIYFLDSDDMIESGALQVLLYLAEKNELDILMFSAKTIYENDLLKAQHVREEDYFRRKGITGEIMTGNEFLKECESEQKYCVCPPLHFYRATFLKKNKLKYFEGIYHEDELFFAQSLLLAKKVMAISDELYIRRFHENSTMTMNKSAKHFNGLFVAFAKELGVYLSMDESEKADATGFISHIEYLLCLLKLTFQDMSALERGKILEGYDVGYKLLFEALLGGGSFDTPILGTITDIQNSLSFKIGQKITYVPRKIRDIGGSPRD